LNVIHSRHNDLEAFDSVRPSVTASLAMPVEFYPLTHSFIGGYFIEIDNIIWCYFDFKYYLRTGKSNKL
jgi:hypothetical protein